MDHILKKSFATPDNVSTPAATIKIETVMLGDIKVMKFTTQPGWVWTKQMKPIMGTDICQMDHLLFMISGQVAAKMADGTELEFGPGEVGRIMPGHDGWTVGNEPAVWIELPH